MQFTRSLLLLLLVQLQLFSAKKLRGRCPPDVVEVLSRLDTATLFTEMLQSLNREDPTNCKQVSCSKIYSPVCSTNGYEYDNECLALSCNAKIECQGTCTCGNTTKKTEDPTQCKPVKCPAIYAPVCSTGNVTHSNACVAESCGAEVACEGECPCPVSTQQQGTSKCTASKACPKILDYVCTASNQTFDNACLADACNQTVACKGGCPCSTALVKKAATMESSGTICMTIYKPVCSTDNRTFSSDCFAGQAGADVACQGECPCKVSSQSLSGCSATKPCPLVILPVCTTDNTQFDNACLAESCNKTVACQGECPCATDSSSTSPDAGSAKPPICPTIYAPVCSTDNTTHASACMAEAAGADVACQGECPCKATSQSASGCSATKPCPLIIRPVCTTDNIQFDNACLAESCNKTVACQGECPCAIDSPSASPDAGSSKPAICPTIYAPVCSIDNTTHASACMAEAAGADVACQGECPCPDLLSKLEAEGGVLLVPSDALIEAQLQRANMTWAELIDDEDMVRLQLAALLVLDPKLNAKRNGTSAASQAGHTLRFMRDPATGERMVADLEADTAMHVARIKNICSVTLVEVDSIEDTEEDYGEISSAGSEGSTVSTENPM